MTDRERFEAWASGDGLWPAAVARYGEGGYRLMQTANAWGVWQASRKQALEDCKAACASQLTMTMPATVEDVIRNRTVGDCLAAIALANPEGEQE